MNSAGIRWMVIAAIAGCVAACPAMGQSGGTSGSCEDLAKSALKGARIVTAKTNPAANGQPAHCEIEARINERTGVDGKPYWIGFHLRMPADWNQSLYFQGGGGLDGNLGNALGGGALAKGYAVVSTDGGHISEPAPGVGGALFGLDPKARLDYGYNSVDESAKMAKALIELYYGKKPARSYFVGCSNGGRQAMVEAEKFPEDFDGIIAGDPGFNLPEAAVAEAWDSQAFAKATTVKDATGEPYLPASFSDADLALVSKAILEKCDALDGLADGMIFNLKACHFDPAPLTCPAAKEASCLTPQQVTALNTVFGGPKDSHGKALYASWPWDAGIGEGGWRIWKIGFDGGGFGGRGRGPGRGPGPGAAGGAKTNGAINLTLGASALPYVFVTPPVAVPADQLIPYVMNFNFDTDAHKIYEESGKFTQASMQFMTANSTDLRKFQKRGGKLILYHGGSDPAFSMNDTVAWYEKLEKANAKTQEFARLYLVPGMNHCNGGPATDTFDSLSALTGWVEQGKAPDFMIGSAGRSTPWPGRTRPLCAYPKQARYKGSGDVNDAANFSCELPK